MAMGLLLVAAGLALRAFIPNEGKGGADFFMGLLMGAGIAIESVALRQARRAPSLQPARYSRQSAWITPAPRSRTFKG